MTRTIDISEASILAFERNVLNETAEDLSTFMSSSFSNRFTEDTWPSKRVCSYIEAYMLRLQTDFWKTLSKYEEQEFTVDQWRKPGQSQGGGISYVMQKGKVFDKAGINVTVFADEMSLTASNQIRKHHTFLEPGQLTCFVTGISCILHHVNPMVPGFHFNIRFFAVKDKLGRCHWWFGGGCDLAPYYIFEEDIKYFHRSLKNVCDQCDETFYPRFKKWCDDYFYIQHRGELRGVGGIFFDDLNSNCLTTSFRFVQSFGDSLIQTYVPILTQHLHDPFTCKEKDWQLYLRGRHVEFTMMYDRGFRFGILVPQARIESVMVAIPLTARFDYNRKVQPGTEEYRTLHIWKNPRDWV